MSRIEEYLLIEKTKKYSKSDIKKIVDDADMAFWATVADLVPEASSGDLDPALVNKLRDIQIKAVTSWIAWNMPE